MRNWNIDRLSESRPQKGGLPDYLWGIETRIDKEENFDFTLPDYLWGIETDFYHVSTIAFAASRLPMRNWNAQHQKFYIAHSLPDYLWGIETNSIGKRNGTPGLLPDYLWGIETLINAFLHLRHFQLPDYLWGIETFLPAQKRPCGVLPDYLWGIETGEARVPPGPTVTLPDYLWGIETFFSHVRYDRMGFQTTYEELKLFKILQKITEYLPLPDYLWGIETQRPERYHLLGSVLPDYLWGIETREGSPGSQEDLASRLPMRNWNPDVDWSYKADQASRLPMRNWNFETLRGRGNRSPLPDYLWGIETRYLLKKLSRSWSFQTTYEELKPTRSPGTGRTEVEASRLPMRNWNQLQQTGLTMMGWLPDYLWGIETPTRGHSRACDASRLPMRNWNTDAIL